jgi:hypothetical protein
MFRPTLLMFPLVLACSAAKPTDYSTDMVMLQGSRVMQTNKLYVSGQKSRVEGFTAEPLGRIVTIARKDKASPGPSTWTSRSTRKDRLPPPRPASPTWPTSTWPA